MNLVKKTSALALMLSLAACASNDAPTTPPSPVTEGQVPDIAEIMEMAQENPNLKTCMNFAGNGECPTYE